MNKRPKKMRSLCLWMNSSEKRAKIGTSEYNVMFKSFGGSSITSFQAPPPDIRIVFEGELRALNLSISAIEKEYDG
jgi:hypothetical protein